MVKLSFDKAGAIWDRALKLLWVMRDRKVCVALKIWCMYVCVSARVCGCEDVCLYLYDLYICVCALVGAFVRECDCVHF